MVKVVRFTVWKSFLLLHPEFSETEGSSIYSSKNYNVSWLRKYPYGPLNDSVISLQYKTLLNHCWVLYKEKSRGDTRSIFDSLDRYIFIKFIKG